MSGYPFRIRKAHLRAQWWDYSGNAIYFVTICTKDRICHFGDVEDGSMVLNNFGRIVQKQWEWLFEQYPYCVNHAFVVMPNHFHGLIEIDPGRVGKCRDTSLHHAPAQPSPVKIKPLSELMGAFKTTSSKKIHLAGNAGFKWQNSFHDRIVRDSAALESIRKYITENPKHWQQDEHSGNYDANDEDTR